VRLLARLEDYASVTAKGVYEPFSLSFALPPTMHMDRYDVQLHQTTWRNINDENSVLTLMLTSVDKIECFFASNMTTLLSAKPMRTLRSTLY
jgi:hypothetical protein